MNREEKRKYEQQLKARGASSNDIRKALLIREYMALRTRLHEGDKVKLDVQKIRDSPDWRKYSERYKQFVEENEDKIFTVEYDEKHSSAVVCLKEDPSEVKWLWWEGNLVKVTEDKHGE